MKFLKIALTVVLFTSCATRSDVKFNETLDEFQYPFQTSTFNLKSQDQDLSMVYMDIGDVKSKRTVILLHGKNFSGYYWEKIAKSLVEKGFRVIIPDQIGFGKSSKPKRYQYNFSQLALNTKKVLDSLEISKPIVVGHSMGGMLAATYAYNYPMGISKLILINPIGLEAYGKYAKYQDTNFFYKRELSKTLLKIRNYQKKFYYDGQWSDSYEELLIPHMGQLNGSDWSKVAWSNALTYSPIFSEDIVSKFSSIKTPTALIIGTRDRTGPGRGWKKSGVKYKLGQYQNLGKKALEKFPNAKLYELKGLGHMPQFENYNRFIQKFNIALK